MGNRKGIPSATRDTLWGKAAGCCQICSTPLFEVVRPHLRSALRRIALELRELDLELRPFDCLSAS